LGNSIWIIGLTAVADVDSLETNGAVDGAKGRSCGAD